MKKLLIIPLVVTSYFLFSSYFVSAEEHKHKSKQTKSEHENEKAEGHADHDENDHASTKEAPHKDEKSGDHAESEDHAEHEESNVVGPEKGIVAYDEDQGLKLSPEAEKNFSLVKQLVKNKPVKIPTDGLVLTLEEKNIFIFRNGFYRRLDIHVLSKSNESVTVDGKDLKIGDEIIIKNVGFLRIAEIAATGGAPEGHSH